MKDIYEKMAEARRKERPGTACAAVFAAVPLMAIHPLVALAGWYVLYRLAR